MRESERSGKHYSLIRYPIRQIRKKEEEKGNLLKDLCERNLFNYDRFSNVVWEMKI